jgi:apolipoprotein N-acyltransferase
VRAANTGISSFVSPTGKILRQSEVQKRETLTAQIQIVKNKTAYTRFGDVILYLSWIYAGFCLILKITHKTKKEILP